MKQKVARLAFWSIVVAFVVLGLKTFAWWITGSVALYSDALESIVNVVTAIAALWAIRVSHRPADRDHQHGHHKAEYFAAVLEGAMIIVAALLIMSQVFRTLSNPSPLEQPWEGLAVNGFAAVLNAIWAFVLIRQGRSAKSPALEADGHHLMTDVMTSGGVIAGLILAVLTGWTILDPLLAALVAINILIQGWKIMGESLSGLMDKAVSTEEHIQIRDIISNHSRGAIEVHDLKTRIAGRATFIEFHLIVDGDMSVRESHVICDRIEEALKAEIPSVRITIHVEPDDEAKLPPGTSAVPFA
ncbi:cation diffusion facilitator family transporter [Mesorhizobium sp. YM1C-6-2]|uniref:cation diffusion facilitator family transporter n=1 Tax=Mesorhizobium sp. YM1C-6-2 TaxID=1827501 RepID=UPI0016025513|nr:cation diffusion facilitator family transporter [Mesorhizobium sp. YM1C-6-2]